VKEAAAANADADMVHPRTRPEDDQVQRLRTFDTLPVRCILRPDYPGDGDAVGGKDTRGERTAEQVAGVGNIQKLSEFQRHR
jgi:hypothetical protein